MSGRNTSSAGRPVAGVDPGPGPADLYDVGRLAMRLGVTPATLRTTRRRGVTWLPAPIGELNGGAVWAAKDLEGIEERRRPPGRPRAEP
ncbi:hypothetical protein [Agromyces sp. GXQ0307]|uniref:hypothetical protein n=1 Tax=Agromyces sp. GXQ0307 TaxID=3377835 RepID=UPI00383B0C62